MMDAEKFALTFEARKISMRQNKDGFVLVLSIHPNDLPQSLLTAWVGTNWQVAMVQVEDGVAVEPLEKKEGNAAVSRAGLLCRNSTFQTWLLDTYENEHPSAGLLWDAEHTEKERENVTASLLRTILGIESRSEIARSIDVLARFQGITEMFEGYIDGRNQASRRD